MPTPDLFIQLGTKCVSQIVALAEDKGFRIYVAWQYRNQVKSGIYYLTKSSYLYTNFSKEQVLEAISFGSDISHTEEAKSIFPRFVNCPCSISSN